MQVQEIQNSVPLPNPENSKKRNLFELIKDDPRTQELFSKRHRNLEIKKESPIITLQQIITKLDGDDYFEDHIKSLFKKELEEKEQIAECENFKFIESRDKTIDFMLRLADKHGLGIISLYSGIKSFDIYLSKNPPEEDKNFIILATVMLMISHKYHGLPKDFFNIREVCFDICNEMNLFKKPLKTWNESEMRSEFESRKIIFKKILEETIELEETIVFGNKGKIIDSMDELVLLKNEKGRKLCWTWFPSILTEEFRHFFSMATVLSVPEIDKKRTEFVEYLHFGCLMAMSKYSIVSKHKTSKIVSSSILFSLFMITNEIHWNKTLELHTRYKLKDIKECFLELCKEFENRKTNSFIGIETIFDFRIGYKKSLLS